MASPLRRALQTTDIFCLNPSAAYNHCCQLTMPHLPCLGSAPSSLSCLRGRDAQLQISTEMQLGAPPLQAGVSLVGNGFEQTNGYLQGASHADRRLGADMGL